MKGASEVEVVGGLPKLHYFSVAMFAHFQYVLIDIWISHRVLRQHSSPPATLSPVPSEQEFIN